MNDKLIKQEGAYTAVQALRALLTIDFDDALSISKTAVKDGGKGLIVRGLSLIQRWNEHRFTHAFLSEIEEMRSEGKIRDDIDQTDAGVSSVREFFEFIDGKPDEQRFRAFCALFMNANAPDANESEGILDLELMGILRKLSAGEMHVLNAMMKVERYTVAGPSLFKLLGEQMGFNSEALVWKNAAALVDNKLVQSGWHDQSGSGGTEKPLLTDLGVALRDKVERYNAFKESTSEQQKAPKTKS